MAQAIGVRDSRNDAVRIKIDGTFDFSVHKEFRASYEGSVKKGVPVVVDMREVEYIDSSALGMLLMLREYLGDDKANITLEVRSPDVRNILKVSNFHQLFHIR